MEKFIKLSDLINDQFTVKSVGLYKFQKWDNEQKKMLKSDKYEAGYRKVYPVTTDKGLLDLGPGQLGNLLESVLFSGKADLNGQTFHVKSNGKDGLDRRYYFNPVKDGVDEAPEEEMQW